MVYGGPWVPLWNCNFIMYSWGDIIPYIIYCANTVTADALVLFGFSNVMGRYVLQPFMWLFCQFVAEMTFSLLRDGYSVLLIPAFLWVKSAFLHRRVLQASPLRGWVPSSWLLGGTQGGTVLYIVYYIYECLRICFPLSAFLAFVIPLSPFFSPPFVYKMKASMGKSFCLCLFREDLNVWVK